MAKTKTKISETTNSPLMAKLTTGPLLIDPNCEELFVHSILGMETHAHYADAMTVHDAYGLSDDFWDDEDEFISWLRPYNVSGGVLTIPVYGVLINKLSIKFGGFATGYTYIERAVERGLADPEVQAIAFDIDSPGGEVAGNFDLVEKIAAQRGEKPMFAFANDHAFSAAYSIATAADEIVLSRSGGVGSVGVVTMHMDVSERMAKMGVKITFIYAGKHKVEGNPYEALPEAAKARIQDRIDRIYGEFVALVAENRGLEEQAVRDTEALTYDASNALDVGFADKIGAMEEEMAAFREAATEGSQMALQPKPKTAAAENESGITQAQMEDAVSTAKAEGMTEGATAAKDRINAILGCDEAKARPKAAFSAAMNTDMSVDQAKAFLADLPEEQAAAPAPAPKAEGKDAPAPTPFAEHMDGPGIGANVEGDGEGGDGPDLVAQITGAYSAQTGRPMKKAS